MKWARSGLARDRRAPTGFVRPCQPILSATVPIGPSWIHEIKVDGYRIVAMRDGARVRIWSRNARDWSRTFTGIADAMGRLAVAGAMLDGEAVMMRPDGRTAFHGLRTRPADAVLIAWDLLTLEGEDLRPLPLLERRRRLADLLAGAPDALHLSDDLEGEAGAAMFKHACELGLEGIVSKRKDSPYRSGPADTWRKTKCANYRRPTAL